MSLLEKWKALNKSAGPLSVLPALADDLVLAGHRALSGRQHGAGEDADLGAAADAGHVGPHEISGLLDAQASHRTAEGVRSGAVTPSGAEASRAETLAGLHQQRSDLEGRAQRGESAAETAAATPSDYVGSLSGAATATALGTGINRLMHGAEGAPLNRLSTYGRAAKDTYGPASIGVLSGLGLAGSLVKAYGDPRRQRGEIGFMGSLGDVMGGEAEGFQRSFREARQNYGLLGALPIQAFQTLTSPVQATYGIVNAMRKGIFGEQGKQAAAAAEAAIWWECRD